MFVSVPIILKEIEMKAYIHSLNFSTFPYSTFVLFVLFGFLSNKSREQKFVEHNKCCLACSKGGQEAARCKVLRVS